jgi:hypothetical protein
MTFFPSHDFTISRRGRGPDTNRPDDARSVSAPIRDRAAARTFARRGELPARTSNPRPRAVIEMRPYAGRPDPQRQPHSIRRPGGRAGLVFQFKSIAKVRWSLAGLGRQTRLEDLLPVGATLQEALSLPPRGRGEPALAPTYGGTHLRPVPARRSDPEGKKECPRPLAVPSPWQAGCHRSSPTPQRDQ